MTKFICALDLFGHQLILLLGSAFLVYQNNFFAGQLMYICWLPYSIYLVFNLASYKEFPNLKQSLFSILNICFLSVLLLLNQLDLYEFVLGIIMGEVVAISAAVSYFFLFKQGLGGIKASELFGSRQAIILALLFTAIIYPYIGEAAIYIQRNGASFYLFVAFVGTFISGLNQQIKSIDALVKRKNKNPKLIDEELKLALDKNTPMDFDTKAVLISLGLWLVVVGGIYVVYVHNA